MAVNAADDGPEDLRRVIATAFRNPVDAHWLLRRIGYPRELWPNFTVSPREAWDSVFGSLDDGTLDAEPFRRMAVVAAGRYPGNAVFRRWAAAVRHVLVVGASPDGGEEVRGDRELRAIVRGAGDIRVTGLLAASAQDLTAVGELRPDVLHLVCHGDDTTLLFETDDGEAAEVPAAAVAELLAVYRDQGRIALRGVVLNACLGARIAPLFREVAETVIAHAGELDDACAVAFAGRLYTELGITGSLASAARAAAATAALTSSFCATMPTDLVVLPDGAS